MSNFDIVEKSWKISSRQKTISALYLYPIKSCAPLKITEVTKDFIWLDSILLKIVLSVGKPKNYKTKNPKTKMLSFL